MSMRDRIEIALQTGLCPDFLMVKDVSHTHRGHAGYGDHGESHFNVVIVSNAFANLSRINRHKRVYALLTDEFKSTLHALSLKTMTPDEYAALKEKDFVINS